MKTNLSKRRWISILLTVCVFVTMFSVSSVMAAAEEGGVAVNSTNFPDAVFRQYVSENIDSNSDDILTLEERTSVTKIDVTNRGCGSLQGIEYFTKLERLLCNGNKLKSLDVSKNPKLEVFYCDNNRLTGLDVSCNPVLKQLQCTNNQLTSLDISYNPALEQLICSSNQLKLLDVSKNPKIDIIRCQ